MSGTAKALVIPNKQGAFEIRDIPIPTPAAGEILIKILATSLNPVDWKIHKEGFAFGSDNYPVIVGYDIAGEVVKLGDGVADFAVGDKVLTQAPFHPSGGSFRQYIPALASTTSKIPANITIDQAAAIPCVLTAAYVGLYNNAGYGLGLTPPVVEGGRGKYAGTPIFVIGGASSVGQMVLQLARLSGFSPIITTANPKNTELLKSLGATVVLDRRLSNEEVVEEVKKLNGGKLIQRVYDAISSDQTQQLGLDLRVDGGETAIVTPLVVSSTETKTAIQVFGSLRAPSNIELLESLYHDHLYSLIEQGLIKPNNVEVIPNGLAGIPMGLDKLEAGVSGCKLVSHPQETP